MFRNYRQTLKDILKDISKDCVWFSKIWANVCWNAELVIMKCCLLLCRSKINVLLHGHWWELDADPVKIPTLTMSRWQRVVFNPGRILFSAPRLSNSLRGSAGSARIKSRTHPLPRSLQEDDVTSGGPSWIPGILRTNCVCFCTCARIRQPCGHQLQRSPVCWLQRCWLAAAYKGCWPLRTTSRRASASLTVSPSHSHIMTLVSHLEVPAFSITINGFTCTDMLLTRATWTRRVGIQQDFCSKFTSTTCGAPQAAVDQLSTKSWTWLLQHKRSLQTQTVVF